MGHKWNKWTKCILTASIFLQIQKKSLKWQTVRCHDDITKWQIGHWSSQKTHKNQKPKQNPNHSLMKPLSIIRNVNVAACKLLAVDLKSCIWNCSITLTQRKKETKLWKKTTKNVAVCCSVLTGTWLIHTWSPHINYCLAYIHVGWHALYSDCTWNRTRTFNVSLINQSQPTHPQHGFSLSVNPRDVNELHSACFQTNLERKMVPSNVSAMEHWWSKHIALGIAGLVGIQAEHNWEQLI